MWGGWQNVATILAPFWHRICEDHVTTTKHVKIINTKYHIHLFDTEYVKIKQDFHSYVKSIIQYVAGIQYTKGVNIKCMADNQYPKWRYGQATNIQNDSF